MLLFRPLGATFSPPAILQKPPDYFFSNRERFPVVVNEQNGVEGNDDDVFHTDDYRNLYRSVSPLAKGTF